MDGWELPSNLGRGMPKLQWAMHLRYRGGLFGSGRARGSTAGDSGAATGHAQRDCGWSSATVEGYIVEGHNGRVRRDDMKDVPPGEGHGISTGAAARHCR